MQARWTVFSRTPLTGPEFKVTILHGLTVCVSPVVRLRRHTALNAAPGWRFTVSWQDERGKQAHSAPDGDVSGLRRAQPRQLFAKYAPNNAHAIGSTCQYRPVRE